PCEDVSSPKSAAMPPSERNSSMGRPSYRTVATSFGSAAAAFVSPFGRRTAASAASVTKDHSVLRLNVRLIGYPRCLLASSETPTAGTASGGSGSRVALLGKDVREDLIRLARPGDGDRHGRPD